MPFSVFGFQSGILDTARLQIALSKHNALLGNKGQEQTMRGYTVGAAGLPVLEEKFGRGFENFVILDDVAIKACKTLKFDLGPSLGSIEFDDLGTRAMKLFEWKFRDAST
jgi:hypothetical protein